VPGRSRGVTLPGVRAERDGSTRDGLRVALVGNWPRPFGGVAIHVEALWRALRARGIDVAVVDIGEGRHADGHVRRARSLAAYADALARCALERRLVHVHTSGANPKSWLVALGAGLARRPTGARAVLTVHSGSAPTFLRARSSHRSLAALACSAFGRVVAVNAEIAAELARAGVRPGRIEILAAYTPTLLEPPQTPPALAAFRAAHAPMLSAYLGPGPIYGAGVLLEAFARVRARRPAAGLACFGAHGDERIRGPGLLGLGELGHRAALGVLEASDAFVRPTLVDGDAVTVREALALGTPVVASDAAPRPDGCVTFRTGDAAELAARLDEVLAAPRTAPPAAGPDPVDRLVEIYRELRAHPGERGRAASARAGRTRAESPAAGAGREGLA
jgi:glycosyltransferase involved in cell wall biosynthesis